MVKTIWAHTPNFKDVVELVEECGGSEIQTRLLIATKNVT